jgi:hypothetical protein
MAMIRLGAALLALGLVHGCSSEQGSSLGGEESEQVQLPQIKVNLPQAPSFEKEHAPERYTDSSYSVYGLRKNSKTTLGQDVRVKGYMLEVYECPPCPKGTKCKDCDKPHLFLSDRANGPKDEALMVTDLPKEDPKAPKKRDKKAAYDVGQQYFFNGTFAKSSGSGFSNSDGLLIYKEGKKVSDQ